GEWLVVDVRQARNEIERLARGYREFSMIGPQVVRHGRRIKRLVVSENFEADRKRSDLPQAGLPHQSDDGRGVDAARQKCAKRHIGNHAPRDGVLEQRLQLLRQVGIAAVDRKSTRLNSSHSQISYAVFCLKKKKKKNN